MFASSSTDPEGKGLPEQIPDLCTKFIIFESYIELLHGMSYGTPSDPVLKTAVDLFRSTNIVISSIGKCKGFTKDSNGIDPSFSADKAARLLGVVWEKIEVLSNQTFSQSKLFLSQIENARNMIKDARNDLFSIIPEEDIEGVEEVSDLCVLGCQICNCLSKSALGLFSCLGETVDVNSSLLPKLRPLLEVLAEDMDEMVCVLDDRVFEDIPKTFNTFHSHIAELTNSFKLKSKTFTETLEMAEKLESKYIEILKSSQ